MIIVKLMGGLGNQMFQYAYGRAQSILKNKKLYLDISSYNIDDKRNYDLDIFNIEENIIENNNISNCTILHDFFQDEELFINIKDIIKKDFIFKYGVNDNDMNIYNEIINSDSVMVHFRRTDYVISENEGGIHITPDLNNYYYKSVDLIKKHISNPKFFIFSDDIEWCKENFKLDNATYIGKEIDTFKHNSFKLMCACKHSIIANSTYSWWSAWLSTNKNKIIISPKMWYKNRSCSLHSIGTI